MDGFRSRSEPPFPPQHLSCPDLGDLCPPLTLTLPACISILKMFSADKKRVETALESCGLNFNRSESIRPDEFSLEIFERFLNKLCLRPDIDKILLEM